MAAPVLLYGPTGKPLKYRSGGWRGGNNRLINPANPNRDRKWPEPLASDLHRNITPYGREILLSLGRKIYFNVPIIRGAIEDTVVLTAGHYEFQSNSRDDAFKEASEQLLYEHDRDCDVAGWPFNHLTFREIVIRSMFIDGDVGLVNVIREDGLPCLQLIPSHRICSNGEDEVKGGGPFDGNKIVDGVIVDGKNKALAYRVQTGDSADEFIDIPAGQMRLIFDPIFPGQVRGISKLGLAAWFIQDLDEARRWELLAQKAGASRVFVEYNESGEPQPGANYVEESSSSGGTVWREVIDGGGITDYFRANTGSKLEAVAFDRPSSNQREFAAREWRELLLGTGPISIDLSVDLTKIGGASARLLIDKMNRGWANWRCKILEGSCRNFDFFRLGVFQQLGMLPFAEDWHRFGYQPGERLTADKGYDSKVNVEQLRIGIKTRAQATMELGESLEDVRNKREAEARDLFSRAKKLAEEFEIPFGVALNRLESDTAEAAVMSTYVSQTASADDDPTDEGDTGPTAKPKP